MVLARILEPLSRKLSVDFRYTAIFSFRPRAVVSGCGDFVHSIVYVFFFLFFFYNESVDKDWLGVQSF